MEVERDELNEELEKGDMQMEYIRVNNELFLLISVFSVFGVH